VPITQLHEKNTLASALWNSVPVLCLLLDETEKIVAVNPAAEKRIGHPPLRLRGEKAWETFVPEKDREKARRLFTVTDNEAENAETVLPILDARGNVGSVAWKKIRLESGYTLFVGDDLTEYETCRRNLSECEAELERLLTKRINLLEKRNEQLNTLSVTDHLTGLYNRRHFDNMLSRLLKRHKRRNDRISLIMCDIDFFKAYNDLYGHTAGDLALKKLARIFKRCIQRKSDVIARYGGEEFAIILPETDREGAELIAECIRKKLAEKRIRHEASTLSEYLTISIGIITAEASHIRDSYMLVRLADRELYEAKRRGRDTIVSAFYTATV